MLKQYILSFSAKLQSVDTTGFIIDRYPAAYLHLLISQHIYYLHLYAQVLEKVIRYSTKEKEEIVLLDYGAGNGLLGMFAKHCGFKKVYSIDVNESFVQAARLLNTELRSPLDDILAGDIDTAITFFKTNPAPDAVAGTDVIEHIYNLNSFLKSIKSLNANMITVFTTASVTANPFKSYAIKKLQLQDEYKWSDPEHTTSNNPFAGLPFLEVRKRMIEQYFHLDANQTRQLALATRGMQEGDIIKAAKAFIETKRLPQLLHHPTNTCDPVTGSWTERLLTAEEYKAIYNNAGFELSISNGFYNEWQAGFKSWLLRIVNKYIRFSGRFGQWISPYIVLAGK